MVARKPQDETKYRSLRGEKSQIPAIVLGCHKIGLGIIRSLGQDRVPIMALYYNPHDMGYVSKYVVERKRIPHPDRDPDAFIRSLLDLKSEWDGSVLIPSDDGTLMAVSKALDILRDRFRVIANRWEITRKYVEKIHTYRLAKDIGVLCPETSVVATEDDAVQFGRVVGYPCILKPCVGHRFFETLRAKMIIAKNEAELRRGMARAAEIGVQMMVQEYIPGGDGSGVNYNCFVGPQGIEAEFTARKIRLSPPRIGFPRVVISERIPDIIEPGRRIIAALGYVGFACTEFKLDHRDRTYKLMEVNGRQNLSALLAVRCGLNFARLAYLDALGLPLPKFTPETQEGIYWTDIEADIIESWRSRRVETYSIWAYLRPYAGKHVDAVISFHDPKPIAKRIWDGIRAPFMNGVVTETAPRRN